MPFNLDEFDSSPDEAAAVGAKPSQVQPSPESGSAAAIVAEMLHPAVPVGEAASVEEAMGVADDEYMNEVVERLDVAAHYQLLLRDSFFSDPNTRVARRVTFELRAWVRERLAELVGMSTPKKAALSDSEVEIVKALAEFTPRHLQALKLLAEKVINVGQVPSPPLPPTSADRKPPKASAPTLVKRGPVPGAGGASAPADEPRRGPGRPPGSPNKPKAPAEPEMVQAIRRSADGSEEPLFNKDGSPRMVKKIPKQMAAGRGAKPFPKTLQQMTAATQHMSEKQANRGTDQHGQQIGGLVELAKTLPEGEY